MIARGILACLIPIGSIIGSAIPDKNSVEVRLKDPIFVNGTLSTNEGGIVLGEGIRIQARTVRYTETDKNKEQSTTLYAEGDLLVEYRGRFLTGDSLFYDFSTRTGVIKNGRVAYDDWFVGGETVRLLEDGSCLAEQAFVTTSENRNNTWAIRSKKVTVSKDRVLKASDITLNIEKIPLLWLPVFKSDLGFVSDSPIGCKVRWDKGIGPRLTVRYRTFSSQEWNVYTRLDYRIDRGLGAAIETEYRSESSRTVFVTRNYGAHDKVVSDEHGPKRYRLQGLLTHESEDKKTKLKMTYDKFHDLKMISDFPSSDFEIDTQQRSRLMLLHTEENVFGNLDLSVRLNPFESLNQKLPLLKIGIRPFPLGSSGIISENIVSAGYLDYVYATDLLHKYPALRETHAIRLTTRNRLYRPFVYGPIRFTPQLGVLGIFYDNNPRKNPVGQGLISYGAYLTGSVYKPYGRFVHSIQPYAEYVGLSKPKSSPDDHYTFTIEDGIYQINALRIGVKNSFAFSDRNFFSPDWMIDLYTYGFFADTTYSQAFPKYYLSVSRDQPKYRIESMICRNEEEKVWDFWNVLGKFTVSRDTALIAEFRHRSRYDWRKADHENFLLDMARPIPELLSSPLSDGRNTLLGALQVKLSPRWNCRFSSHYGWGRAGDPPYHAFQIDTTTLIASKWQLKFSYMHTTNDDRFTMQTQLL